jgi:hypothetical protein
MPSRIVDQMIRGFMSTTMRALALGTGAYRFLIKVRRDSNQCSMGMAGIQSFLMARSIHLKKFGIKFLIAKQPAIRL